uniref:Uncharacterized protein n=1 Tax=Arundo donax TaxID=35708 RepID=A0A0A9FQG8_ARUDO
MPKPSKQFNFRNRTLFMVTAMPPNQQGHFLVPM